MPALTTSTVRLTNLRLSWAVLVATAPLLFAGAWAAPSPDCSVGDSINTELKAIKWKDDGAPQSFFDLASSQALSAWYTNQLNAGHPMPNIDAFFKDELQREFTIQNGAGTKSMFWLASGNNYALMAPQVRWVMQDLASDVIVMRVNASPPPTKSYQFFPDEWTGTSQTMGPIQIDYTTLYRTIAANTLDQSHGGAKRALLGYSFSTKAIVPPNVGDALKYSTLTESKFAQFSIGSQSGNANLTLYPGEFISDPPNTSTALRNCAPGGCTPPFADDIFYPNYASAATRQKEIDRTGSAIALAPSLAGLAHDLTLYDPTFDKKLVTSAAKSGYGAQWVCDYQAGLRAKFEVGAQKGYFMLFNLLDHGGLDGLNDLRARVGYDGVKGRDFRLKQEELLQHAHGGLVEFFGGHVTDSACVNTDESEEVCDSRTKFYKRSSVALLEQVQEWRRNPEKSFMVAGRGPQEYVSYQEEYDWQEYLYGVYLLGAGANTAFKYLSVFQFPSDAGRTDGLHTFDNQHLYLGRPKTSPYRKTTSGLYFRQFLNDQDEVSALVVVNPHDSGSPEDTKPITPFLKSLAPDGATMPDTLQTGRVILATPAARRTSVGRLIDYSDAQTQARLSENEIMSVYPAVNPTSVRVKESDGDDSVNDFLLTTVKYRSHGGSLKLDFSPLGLRPGQTPRRITLVAEVDDDNAARQPRYRTVVFELWGADIPPDKQLPSDVARPLFRDGEKTRSNAETAMLIRLKKFENKPDQSIGLSPQAELDKVDKALKFRRWDMMRLHGDFSLKRLSIGSDPQPITGAKDF